MELKTILHDGICIRAVDVQSDSFYQFTVRYPVEILSQRFNVLEPILLRDIRTACGHDVIQLLCPAQSLGKAVFCVPEGDSEDIDLLNILFQRRREGEIPVRRGDHDLVCGSKLPGQMKKRVMKDALGDQPIAFVKKYLVNGGTFENCSK